MIPTLILMGAIALASDVSDVSVEAVLRQGSADVQRIVDLPLDQRTFRNTVEAIDDITTRVRNATGMRVFLSSVSPNTNDRRRGDRDRRAVVQWQLQMWQRRDLYHAVLPFIEPIEDLKDEHLRLVGSLVGDFRRQGGDLPADTQQHLQQLSLQLEDLQNAFLQNITSDLPCLFIDKTDLVGVPRNLLTSFTQSQQRYRVCLDHSTYSTILTHCDVSATRQKLFVVYHQRGGRTNVRILEEILLLRARIARLLGYRHAMEFYAEVQMAGSADRVKAFFEFLRPQVRRKAESEWRQLTSVKRDHTGRRNSPLHAWDIAYYEERLRQQEYGVADEQVREFFPLERVLSGLFKVTETIFDIRYEEVTQRADLFDLTRWHPEVRLYQVTDGITGDRLGEVYFDLHPRRHKYGHAAKFSIRKRKHWSDGTLQTPLVALVCNFPGPTNERPSLLNHDQVVTLFHEFGHCLHELFSHATYARLAGTMLARDFAEAPAQLFENWASHPQVLKQCSGHYHSGQPLSAELLSKIAGASKLGIGLSTERQIFYAMLDLQFHILPDGRIDTTAFAQRLGEEIMLVPLPAGTNPHASFRHLIGYRAGYYGYLWSRLYAQDMFRHFQAKGLLNPAAGAEFRRTILAPGGAIDEFVMLRNYLGREPQPDAFLEYLGLADGSESQ